MQLSLDLMVKLTFAIALFNSWVIFEETIIDRHKLWKYLPFYKIGNICVYDLIMAMLIIIFAWSIQLT